MIRARGGRPSGWIWVVEGGMRGLGGLGGLLVTGALVGEVVALVVVGRRLEGGC